MRQRAPSGLKALPGFNPRICKRCDDFKYILKMRNRGFNPRICKRCDTRDQDSATWALSFNPRICKRCDYDLDGLKGKLKVSIHASVKDATPIDPLPGRFPYVSIHASVKDATFAMRLRFPLWFCFNPRICKRCDLRTANLKSNISVSIHASVKDATKPKSFSGSDSVVSIHASVKDATQYRRHCPK